jgi:hypothetical protein
MRSLRRGTPDMQQSDEPEDYAGGNDIGLHKMLSRYLRPIKSEAAFA